MCCLPCARTATTTGIANNRGLFFALIAFGILRVSTTHGSTFMNVVPQKVFGFFPNDLGMISARGVVPISGGPLTTIHTRGSRNHVQLTHFCSQLQLVVDANFTSVMLLVLRDSQQTDSTKRKFTALRGAMVAEKNGRNRSTLL